MDHEINLYDLCYKCHNKTMKWFQYDYGSFGLKCENCGAHLSADLNTPCEREVVYKAERCISAAAISEHYRYWDKCRYPHRPPVVREI